MGLSPWPGNMGQGRQHRRAQGEQTSHTLAGQVIKQSELRGELQFETHEVYASRLKVNARNVEAALQVHRCLLLLVARALINCVGPAARLRPC